MNNENIVRAVDELGRIVIPIDYRKKLNISENEPLEIIIEGEKILLRKNVQNNGNNVKRIDELGRLIIPIEFRKKLDINEKDQLEISIKDEDIILKKYILADVFTGSTDSLIDYKGKKVSKYTIKEIALQLGTDFILELAKDAGLNLS